MRPPFPLSAIVGQHELVDALLVNAVAPVVGGVLVRGQRGTAKSTAVRALAPLLPPVRAALGQAFAFAPGDLAPDGPVAADAPADERPATLVELPVGATADRLVGALDLARALEHREHAFEAGLIARAHQGVLYVDEVNLLPDHLVDLLLDVAASGVCHVERDAVSVRHSARFLLVGTMNAEEGELRPQLLDRFGLGVEVRTPEDPAERAEIVRRRLHYERDPFGFAAAWADADRATAQRIAAARERAEAVAVPERELLRVTGACARLGIDGVRGDIVCVQAARALAALDGADEVSPEHVHRAAVLALAHRRRRDPLETGAGPDDAELAAALGDAPGDDDPDGGGRGPNGSPPRGARQPHAATSGEPDPSGSRAAQTAGARGSEAAPETRAPGAERPDAPHSEARDGRAPTRERLDAPTPGVRAPLRALALRGTGAGPSGRRARASGAGAGAIDSRPADGERDDVAAVATLRARLADADAALRRHVRAGREGVLLCLVVDASGSMGARRRMAATKGALVALLRDAYARRDRVALVAFRDARAEVLCPPGTPLPRAAAALRALPTGGRTPLAEGLDAAVRVIAAERRRHRARRAVAIVVTDGRASDGAAVAAAARRLRATADAVLVLDTEDGPARLGLARDLAAAAGARVVPLATDRKLPRRAA